MGKVKKSVVLVTGASTGIGMSCANLLADEGHIVYGTSRKIERLFSEQCKFHPMQLDVDDEHSVQQAIAKIVRETGRIDVLVNNAGHAVMGAIEDTSIDEAKRAFNTNFFGILRLCNAVIPYMRKNGNGKIINISSVAGKMGLPFRGIYCATKFALEGMSESLRMEVEPFGIKVVIIEPGDTQTEINQTRETVPKALNGSVYKEHFEMSRDLIISGVDKGIPPHQIAQTVKRIIAAPSPKLRYLVGYTHQKLSVQVKKMLPPSVFQWMLKKYYKLT